MVLIPMVLELGVTVVVQKMFFVLAGEVEDHLVLVKTVTFQVVSFVLPLVAAERLSLRILHPFLPLLPVQIRFVQILERIHDCCR
jgi:hypothetical protein